MSSHEALELGVNERGKAEVVQATVQRAYRRPSQQQYTERLLSPAGLIEAMSVECTCPHKKAGTAGCKVGLWCKDGSIDVEGLKANIKQWYGEGHYLLHPNCRCQSACDCATVEKQCKSADCPCIKPMAQKDRGRAIFEIMTSFYQTVEWNGDGTPARKDFKWLVNREPVCQAVFQASIGVSPSVISRLRRRVANPGQNNAYDEAGAPSSTTDSSKTASVVGWGIWYSLSCGDKSPESGKLILPHVEIKFMHEGVCSPGAIVSVLMVMGLYRVPAGYGATRQGC
jgi:hypothetical protein